MRNRQGNKFVYTRLSSLKLKPCQKFEVPLNSVVTVTAANVSVDFMSPSSTDAVTPLNFYYAFLLVQQFKFE